MSRILNNNKALIFIIAVLLIANIAILVFFLGAKHHSPMSGNERGGGNDRPRLTEFLKKEIKFSPEQLKQYDSLKKIHWKAARPVFKAVNIARDSFYIHVKDTVLNEQLLQSAADSIALKQRQMDMYMFTHFRNIRKLCTDEQKPLYDSLVQDMIRRMMNPYRKDKKPEHGGEKRTGDSMKHESR